jgi:hypothetical protein
VNYRATGWNRFFDSQEEAARLHLRPQSVGCQQAIPLIEAAWSQYFRVPGGWSAIRKLADNGVLGNEGIH